jgi:tetratricopeptide (TPR) repeat protein
VAPPTRPIFISGTVVIDDGSPMPGSVNIQSICSASQRTVAHTTPRGDFSFQWADKAASVFADASDSARISGFGGSGSGAGANSATSGRTADPLADCDLRAELPGFTSSRVSLYNHTMDNNIDIGAIVLHRITGDEGTVVSMLSLKAPKDAKKSYEKGTEQVHAKKLKDAQDDFRKAVASYPQYADAWLSLGRVDAQLGSRDEARTDFRKAMDLDVKLVGPWQELGYMSSDEAKWEDAVRYLDQAVKLDPVSSPMAWYFSAMANYNLGHYEAAERSLRAEMKIDRGTNPRSKYLLGLVLIARKDLAGGAEALRSYIASSPNSQEVDTARQQLVRVESALGK